MLVRTHRPMGKLTIKKPMRLGYVGINQRAMADPDLIIDITWLNREGSRVYPHPFKLDWSKGKEWTSMTVKGVKLTVVPMRDLIEITE